MKKVIVIGGKGRVGSYLIPMLRETGFEVINISRGQTTPPREEAFWSKVQQVNLDRNQEDFPKNVLGLKPDVVIDMVCFKSREMERLVSALKGQVNHYLVCGSLWIHGPSTLVPCPEHINRNPVGEYGREKLKMDETIQQLYARSGFPGTIFHPGHIVAEGFRPINPQGNFNLQVFSDLRHGRPVILPNLGMETLHHVHAADIARLILALIHAGSISYGQAFHAASPQAVSLSGYAREVASWFGRKALLSFQPFETWKKSVSHEDAEATYDHLSRSPSASMEKARRLLNFTPRFTSFQAVRAALNWLIQNGDLP